MYNNSCIKVIYVKKNALKTKSKKKKKNKKGMILQIMQFKSLTLNNLFKVQQLQVIHFK